MKKGSYSPGEASVYRNSSKIYAKCSVESPTFMLSPQDVIRVQYSCGVVLVFWSWQEIVFGVTYVLSVQYSYVVVSAFWLWWEKNLKMITHF